MKAVVLGGTKGIGRALVQRMAERGTALFLLGRHDEDLARSAADLQARGATTVGHASCDLASPERFAAALDAADAELGGFDTVVVTAADFATQEELEADPERARQLTTINFANTIAFCEHARARLLARGGGALVVFSSVAGDRARKPVVIYGATKAGLSAYCEGLDHRFHGQGLYVLCVKPGFVKTGMTAALKPPPFAGEPDAVANDVLAALERRRKAVLYTPRIWSLIMLVIRWLPRLVMRKIGF